MAAISFEFITDLRRFLPGIRQVSGGLEDVQAGLRDTVTTAGRLDTELSGAFDNAGASARRFGDDIGDDMRTGIRRAGDDAKAGAKEIGGEIAENLSEGFQSGDFVGVATETAASLTQGLAGLGAGAGAAAGVGFGAVSLIVSQMRQRADQIKEVGRAFGESLAAAMQDGLSAAEIREATVEALKQSLEDTGSSMGEFAKLAAAAGVDFDLLIAALTAGGGSLEELRDQLMDVVAAETHTVTSGKNVTTQVTARGKAARDLADQIDRVSGATRQGTESAIAEADALDGSRKSAADYRRELKRVQDQVERTGSSKKLTEWLNENSRAARRARRDIDDLVDAAAKLVDIDINPFDGDGGGGPRRRPRAHTGDGRRR